MLKKRIGIQISLVSMFLAISGRGEMPGRYVRVELPGEDRVLSIAELQVFSEGRNLALGKSTKQSSISNGGDSARAVDGNTSGSWGDNSITHTVASSNPFWEVDLGKEAEIQEIVIWNRSGGAGKRLNNCMITVLSSEREAVWSIDVPKPGDREVIPVLDPLEATIRKLVKFYGRMYSAGEAHLKRFMAMSSQIGTGAGKLAYRELEEEVYSAASDLGEAMFSNSSVIHPHVPFPINDVEWYQNDSATEWPCTFSQSDENWRPIRWLVRTRWRKSIRKSENDRVTLFGRFQMPEVVLQGMCIKAGGQTREVRVVCNGDELPSRTGGSHIFRLPLRKGSNTLMIRASVDLNRNPGMKRGRKRAHRLDLHLTPVELQYTCPRPVDKLAALTRSVDYLARKYPEYSGAEMREEIKSLFCRLVEPDIDRKIKELQIKALVENNPVIDFSTVLVRRGKSFAPANWHGNSERKKMGWGNEIAALSLGDFSLKTLYRPPDDGSAAVCDICLSFDARKMMFSSINEEEENWQVFEMNVDGSGKRQVTRSSGSDVDNYNGIYLPSGKIIFCSTANMTGVPCVGGKADVGTFYTANADGSGVRQLTFEQDADWYPWVMDDGKIMYLRWEYTDNSHYFTRILMTMMPDGTRQRSIYGSGSYWPNTMFSARNIPGSNSKFTAVCSGHHGVARAGEIVLFDADKGEKNVQGAIQKIPGYKQEVQDVIRDQYAVGVYPYFYHVYPLSDTYFLAAGTRAPGKAGGIYLLDRFDNMVMLKQGDLFEPVPLKPRKRPPEIPSMVNPEAEDSTIYVQDIYEGPGLAGLPRGTVKSLRLFTYSYGYRKNGGHHQLAVEGGWDCKRLLGTVPVEPDGSVLARVPYNTPISIQPLDKSGKSLQYFRSWLVTMPGESLSCVGCHEPANTAPILSTQALRYPPRTPKPWDEHKLHGFGFLREVQPLLDRRCAGCHDGTVADRPNFKNTDTELGFSVSYHALHPYVRRPGPESDFEILEPMEYHSSTSELVQRLEKGHHGVELTSDDWEILNTWIDLNVPYHPTWTSCKGKDKINQIATRGRELRMRYAGQTDDPEWMPPGSIIRSAFQKPTGEVKPKSRPPEVAGWPFDSDSAKQKQDVAETKTLAVGNGLKIRLRFIPSGSFVMGSNAGGEDERPLTEVKIEDSFWMAETEITNREFARFDPTHDSRFIDQQWKDHIYQGYPANKPHMPVIRVTWEQAMEFCRWLSEKTGKKVKLPTEAQWEWACRAGSNGAFWFGSDYGDFANLADEHIGLLAVRGVDPQPISPQQRNLTNDFVPRNKEVNDGRLLADSTKQYTPNEWGLYDMHGNVSEWTRTDYGPYPYKEATSKTGKKVARGGSWRDRAKRGTASYRYCYQPYQKVFNVGFRVIVEE